MDWGNNSFQNSSFWPSYNMEEQPMYNQYQNPAYDEEMDDDDQDFYGEDETETKIQPTNQQPQSKPQLVSPFTLCTKAARRSTS